MQLEKIIKKELINKNDKYRDSDLYELHSSINIQSLDSAEQDDFKMKENEINESYNNCISYIVNTELIKINEKTEKELLNIIKEYYKQNNKQNEFKNEFKCNCNCEEININNINLFMFKNEEFKVHSICNKCQKYITESRFLEKIK